ncbi:hypothetical protein CWI75_13585 [Kineobactrum sediminis]|uniref:Uncharacterized protein n=1 Tax=Kineobactrum sediminis TaxID=1905677 RepID=A0A2N5Y059_9GAMM|nr:YCF48-related protein [Kineobactrum sediminis]PLW81775.1 hypothetical protein CWI75_13585 [Kineobactrum sediminis]
MSLDLQDVSAGQNAMLNVAVKNLARLSSAGLLLAVFAVTTAVSSVQASSGEVPVSVELIREGVAHRPLFGISFPDDGKRGAAVGGRGTVLLTSDSGNSWSVHEVDTNLALLDVALAEDRIIVVGQMGLILVRDKDGTWIERPVDIKERLLSVDAHADGLAVAVGEFGQVRISIDGGTTWAAPDVEFSSFVDEGYDPHLYAVEITNAGRIIVAGEFGVVVISDDRGASWRLVRKGDESISALHVRSDGTGYAVGQNGIVLKTIDSGDRWERVDSGLGGNLLGVSSSPDGLVIVPGMRSMLVSTDDGATFVPVQDSDVNSNWYQQAATAGGGTFAVGHTGRILRLSVP